MLNYLGAAPMPQSGPSMPQGVPGVGGPYDPTMAASSAAAMRNPMMSAGPGMGGLMAPDDPASKRYTTVTQEDGTVLLMLKRADGSPGPVVKIIQMGGQKKPAGS